MSLKSRLGEIHTTVEGCKIEIIEYKGFQQCTIKFDNGYVMKNIQYHNILNGNIKNPFHPSIFDRGFKGVTSKNTPLNNKAYQTWFSMFNRCYNEKYQKVSPTYIGCTVNKEWYDFQVFTKWFLNNYVKGWELDKDILVKGNKEYGPNTCCFVPQEINSLFTKRQKVRGDYPIGVSKASKNRVQAALHIKKECFYLGIFKTPQEAFEEYKKFKELFIKKAAKTWKSQLPENVYIALLNYQVEITD